MSGVNLVSRKIRSIERERLSLWLNAKMFGMTNALALHGYNISFSVSVAVTIIQIFRIEKLESQR